MAKRRPKHERYEEAEPVGVESARQPASIQTPEIAEEDAAQAFAQALANSEAEDKHDGLAYALASQEVLARDWSAPEDDIDWRDWIIPTEDKE